MHSRIGKSSCGFYCLYVLVLRHERKFLRKNLTQLHFQESFFNDLILCVSKQLNTAYDALVSKRPCGPNKGAIRGATYDLAKNDPWKEPFENLPENAFEDIADWERKLIQERVRANRGT